MLFPRPIAIASGISVILSICGLSLAQEKKTASVINLRSGFYDFAELDRPVSVAFLGGSITQNRAGHSAMVPERLREQYPEQEFEAINAGLSSTCSVSGAFRLKTDILDKTNPDLLVVEFAVNDNQDAVHDFETAIRGMEGIIRHVRTKNPETRLLMVQFVNPEILEQLEQGKTPVSIQAHEAVAEHYGITSVNVGAALAAGKMDWKTYGGTHPKKEGYQLASDLILEALGHRGEMAPVPATPLDPANYSRGDFVDPQVASWLGSWEFGPVGKETLPLGSIRGDYEKFQVLRSDDPGAMLYLDFYGNAVGAFILAGPDAGIIETRVDSGPWQRHDLFHRFSKGLNYPRSVILADGLPPGRHQLALKILDEKNEASRGHGVSILFFEVNR